MRVRIFNFDRLLRPSLFELSKERKENEKKIKIKFSVPVKYEIIDRLAEQIVIGALRHLLKTFQFHFSKICLEST